MVGRSGARARVRERGRERGREAAVLALAALALVPLACGGGSGRSGSPASRDGLPTTSHPTTSLPARPRPAAEPLLARRGTAAEPLRALLVGDSVAITFRSSLAAALRQLRPRIGPARILQGAALGFGLSADVASLYEGRIVAGPFPDYDQTWRDHVRFTRPDLVVVMLGTWDVVPRRVDGRWLQPGEPGWGAWYADRLARAVRILTGEGAALVWATEPCLDVPNDPAPVNRLARREIARDGDDRTVVVDVERLVCPGGRFESHLDAPDGRSVRVRRPDGVHFADEAPAALGPLLAGALSDALRLGDRR
jgi:hypothetical protein